MTMPSLHSNIFLEIDKGKSNAERFCFFSKMQPKGKTS